MIFTSYISKLDNILKIPTDKKIYVIMRYLPDSIKPYVDSGKINWLPDLSPSPLALSSYRESFNFDIIKHDIIEQYMTSFITKSYYDQIYTESFDSTVFLLCCEKAFYACHRSIVAEIFNNSYDIPATEWQKETSRFNKIINNLKGED